MNPKEFKSQLESIKDLEERNLAFDALSDEDKRREIAYDCLQLTLVGKMKGRDDSYRNHTINGYWDDNLLSIQCDSSKEFQEKLVKKLPDCSVCVRGGMMLSQIRLGNSISSNFEERSWGDSNNIKGFSFLSFRSMEKEFEESFYGQPYKLKSTLKLQNICLNVIANGDFDIKDSTDYLAKYLK